MAKQSDRAPEAGAPGDDEPTALTAAAHELYSVDPERFVDRRAELAAHAREQGDTHLAGQIAKLRKPTTAAWVVNRLVDEDATIVKRLLELNDRLRGAHEDLDAELLRALSAERRAVVDGLTQAALGAAGRDDAAAQLRDEVRATFDAAVADPSIAMCLGRLQRAQSWSGFGVAPATGPALTVLRGGRDARRTKASRPKTPAQRGAGKPAKPSRALVAARKALSDADAAADSAGAEQRACTERVDSLTTRLSELEAELSRAQAALDQARSAAKAARARQRKAQTALNRAERGAKQ
ncbi:MAG TPA: hypothetical protein VFH38_08360 [Jatrophihabitans sp.]|nr:hypothetical protein [Jatrophihabitans sp.]